MRTCSLVLALLLGACSSRLTQGDRAFAEARYLAAAQSWDRVQAADERAALLFRRALLCATPDSPLFDQAQAQALLTELAEHHGASPYGASARQLLAARQEIDELERHVQAAHAELAALGEARAQESAAHERERQTLQESAAKLEEEHQRLAAELAQLRTEHAELLLLREKLSELLQLRDEKARLQAELEELKLIDLKH